MPDTNEAADFAASLAEASTAAEETPDDSETSAGTEAPAATDELDGEGNLSEGEPAADDDAGSDDEDDAADEEDESKDSGSESLDAIKQKFLDGDIEDALKDLGLDPKILEVNGPKLVAMRKGLKEAKEAEARANAKLEQGVHAEERAKAIIADGKKQYGHLVDLKNALRLGEYTAARDILEALAPEGTTYKQIAEGLAKAAQGMSPSEQVYRKKLRELAEKERKDAEAAEAAKAEQTTKVTTEQLAQKNLDGAKKLLANTELADIPGAAEELVKLAAANWDPAKKGLKVPREQLVKDLAKHPVIGQLLELKRLKAGGKGKPAPKTEAPAVDRDRNTGKFKKVDRALDKNRKADPKAKEKDEFAAALAEATRMEAAERRSRNAGKGRR